MGSIINNIRGVFRLAHLFFYTFYFVGQLLYLDKAGKLTDDNRLDLREGWSKKMASIVGFKFTFGGELPDPAEGPFLYVGNHRSTLDPLLAFYKIQAWPLSRMWIKNWPLVGRGSQLTGIIFVDKEDKGSRKSAKEHILFEMQRGHSIMVFPEGHTHIEPFTKTFHKGAFEQAAKGFGVVPYILEYRDVADYWDHSESFVRHFIRAFGKRRHEIHLGIGPVIRSDNTWTLMRQSRQWIDVNMKAIHVKWGNHHYDGIDPESIPRDNPEIRQHPGLATGV